MRYKWIIALTVLVISLLLVGLFSGLFGQDFTFGITGKKPAVLITYPSDGATVANLVMISGTAKDSDTTRNITSVQIQIDESSWVTVTGTMLWSYDWNTFSLPNGEYTISARSFNGGEYSEVVSITVLVDNPTVVDSDTHKWALFVAAANFPDSNDTKLGNGGLYLAEEMVTYFIETNQYPTSQITVLFDDGWIRSENGYGSRLTTLQERAHEYAITYAGATKANFIASLGHLINESNKYADSEVFLWIFSHGVGNQNQSLTGGKILQRSEIFLWDDTITDKDLGNLLDPLTSKKVAIIIDACYAGGFADRTILNFRSSLFLRSGIPRNGRVVIASTSKFRSGYASTIQGPLFSLLWFEGLSSGDADGCKSGLFDRGVQRRFKFFQNGEVSVEEAFYYARVMLRSDSALKEFKSMQPQINDRYPHQGLLRNLGELYL
jgi:hypothetical protein